VNHLPAILSLLTGVAGWFYMFYSKAAEGLSHVEEQRLNNHRIRLRRVGGAVMLVLAALMYIGWYAVSLDPPTLAAAGVWLAVLVLLALLSVLAMVDMRLTFRLRHRRLIATRASGTHAGAHKDIPAADEDPVDQAAR
jgi:UDP-N-acetylmuramyl pentapeptide phosphotransferase/UDP-N-acetylglucosamine-1-phosphate transferase